MLIHSSFRDRRRPGSSGDKKKQVKMRWGVELQLPAETAPARLLMGGPKGFLRLKAARSVSRLDRRALSLRFVVLAGPSGKAEVSFCLLFFT